MLKGILFIIFIIVTFDIGKTLVHLWNEEQEVIDQSEISDGANPDNRENNKAEDVINESESPKASTLDLSLPSDVSFNEDKQFGEEEALNELDDSSFSDGVNNYSDKDSSKLKLNAKPNLDFSKGVDKTPGVNGASVGIKLELK